MPKDYRRTTSQLLQLPQTSTNAIASTFGENPLRLPILPARDGRARRARRRTRLPLGASRTRRLHPHRIPQPSHRRRPRRMASTPPSPHVSRNHRRRSSLSHMAVAVAQPQSARAHAQLCFLLHLSSATRHDHPTPRHHHRHFAATARRPCWMVARFLSTDSLPSSKSATSWPGVSPARRRSRQRKFSSGITPLPRLQAFFIIKSRPHRRRHARLSRTSHPPLARPRRKNRRRRKRSRSRSLPAAARRVQPSHTPPTEC